ncbi:hypothetical protein Taro_032589 [Colocasia esculenta]|uniref:Inositol-1-monophosphatase n=1 Tax=Colocasia esculenta TaxID=4460 RepID=A0A843W2C0_COLES|nr:hypothetical protein [Colocasia esculenta]
MAQNGSWAKDYLALAVEAAKNAGQVIRKGFYQTKHVEHKGQVDLVTETDKACEDLIFCHLKKHFPDHKFIGEETTAALGAAELSDDPTWIVDPLDGTTNFVHGYPFVCVSIGLTIGKVPTVGVVYNPILNEVYVDRELFLTETPLKVGSKRDKATVDAITNRLNSFLFKVRSIRMSGSCALNLCSVACGRVDMFYNLRVGGPWDVAGGAVIVQEAGGLVFDPSGKDFDITSSKVAATNGYLKDLFVNALE